MTGTAPEGGPEPAATSCAARLETGADLAGMEALRSPSKRLAGPAVHEFTDEKPN